MAKHTFSAEETMKGAKASGVARKKVMKDIKKLTGMELQWETFQEVIRLGQVWVATPVGQVVTGAILLESTPKLHLLKQETADLLTAAIVGAELISGLAQSGGALAAQITPLVAGFVK